MLVSRSDRARPRREAARSWRLRRSAFVTLLFAVSAAGCGPSYGTVGVTALVTALPAALATMGSLYALELLWGPVLRSSDAPRRRGSSGMVGALATIVGLLLHRSALDSRLREAPLQLVYLGLLVCNTLGVALALIAWRCVARSREGAGRDLAPACALAAYWALAALAVLVGRGREVPEAIGMIILWGGALGGGPMVVFAALAVEGLARRSALRRVSDDEPR